MATDAVRPGNTGDMSACSAGADAAATLGLLVPGLRRAVRTASGSHRSRLRHTSPGLSSYPRGGVLDGPASPAGAVPWRVINVRGTV